MAAFSRGQGSRRTQVLLQLPAALRAMGLFPYCNFRCSTTSCGFCQRSFRIDEFLFGTPDYPAWGHHEPHTRNAPWARRKRARRKREQFLDFCVKLCSSREQPVVAAAWAADNRSVNFFCTMMTRVSNDWRKEIDAAGCQSNVVREDCPPHSPVPESDQARSRGAGFRAEQGAEVNCQHVAFDDPTFG